MRTDEKTEDRRLKTEDRRPAGDAAASTTPAKSPSQYQGLQSSVFGLFLSLGASLLQASDELGTRPTWQPATLQAVRTQVIEWLDSQEVDTDLRQRATLLWTEQKAPKSSRDLLARLEVTFAMSNSNAAKLVTHCQQPQGRPDVDTFAWLTDLRTLPLLRNNMRLVYGRWLARHRFFDESLVMLEDLKPEEVVDPAALLFYQSIVHYGLVHQKESLQTLNQLLQRERELPRRYQRLARLMKEDLAGLKIDSLDHIARRMDDIHRRLDFGRANKKVREIEDGVVESLDKLIEELQEQAQRRQQQSIGSAQQQPTRPAEESRILSGTGQGKVDKKDIGSKSDWGNMPAKQREEALQEISRRFPSHYRDVIVQYFRRLANEGSNDRSVTHGQ